MCTLLECQIFGMGKTRYLLTFLVKCAIPPSQLFTEALYGCYDPNCIIIQYVSSVPNHGLFRNLLQETEH